jgi:hypothetical protein
VDPQHELIEVAAQPLGRKEDYADDGREADDDDK